MRGTRISRVRACTRTSTNSAPSAYISFSPLRAAAEEGRAFVELLDGVGLAAGRQEFGIFLDRADAEPLELVLQRVAAAPNRCRRSEANPTAAP